MVLNQSLSVDALSCFKWLRFTICTDLKSYPGQIDQVHSFLHLDPSKHPGRRQPTPGTACAEAGWLSPSSGTVTAQDVTFQSPESTQLCGSDVRRAKYRRNCFSPDRTGALVKTHQANSNRKAEQNCRQKPKGSLSPPAL